MVGWLVLHVESPTLRNSDLSETGFIVR